MYRQLFFWSWVTLITFRYIKIWIKLTIIRNNKVELVADLMLEKKTIDLKWYILNSKNLRLPIEYTIKKEKKKTVETTLKVSQSTIKIPEFIEEEGYIRLLSFILCLCYQLFLRIG